MLTWLTHWGGWFRRFDTLILFHGREATACFRQAACDTTGGEAVTDLSSTTTFIKQVATVFGVTEAGDKLAGEIQASIDQVKKSVPAQPVKVLALSWPPASGQPVNTQAGVSLCGRRTARSCSATTTAG